MGIGVEPVQPLPAGLDPGVARWLEMAEARAYLDTYTALGELPGDPLGARVAVIGGAVAFGVAAIDFFLFDRAIGLGVEQPATRGDVAAISAFYRDLGVGQVGVQVANGAEPAELTTWLAEDGYVPGGRWVKMHHDLRGLEAPAAGLRIERIGPAGSAAFRDVLLAAFEMPPVVAPIGTATIGRPGWSHYVGFDGDVPVSVGAMHVDDGVAWLGLGGTIRQARGRGWQTAMLRRRLADAATSGCRLAVTETGEEDDGEVNPSYRNMLRTGFRLGYARRNWYRA